MQVHNYSIEYNSGKGRSLMSHIRRTRHIMMPSYRSCFSYSIFNSKNNLSSDIMI
ncbi:MAG: leader peptide SpeFL [Pasteurellaceae bacterium]|nr:leader peptide SpeFL [Pasteurellaceae bacterium]